jgi:hypothetical protein
MADPMKGAAVSLQNEEGGGLAMEPRNLIIGPDGRNQWVVIETHGFCGGIFINQAAALRYARQESHGHPESIRIVPDLLVFTTRLPIHREGQR